MRRFVMSLLCLDCAGYTKPRSVVLTRHLVLTVSRIVACCMVPFASTGWTQIAVRIPDKNQAVLDIASINDQIWLSTAAGAYKLSTGEPQLMTDQEVEVNNIAAAQDAVWIATTIGAYKFVAGIISRVPDQILDVYTAKVLPDNRVYLGTATGAYLIDGGTVRPLDVSKAVVSTIEYLASTVWLGTDKGAYKVQSGHVARLMSPAVPVNAITLLKGSIWVATTSGAYEIGDSTSPNVFLPGLNVVKIAEANGAIWFGTEKGLFQLIGGRVSRKPDMDMAVEDVAGIDGAIWIASNRGAYKLTEVGNSELVTQPGTAIKLIQKLEDHIWLGGYHGVFVMREDRAARVTDLDLEVQKFKVINGVPWMATTLGAFRLDPASIVASLKSAESWWKRLIETISPYPVLVSGDVSVTAAYVDADGHQVASGELSHPSFRVVLDERQSELRSDTLDNRYSPADSFVKNVSPGRRELFLGLRDKWGNTFVKSFQVLVIPGPALTLVFLPTLWVIFLAGCIVWAPKSEFANDILMNPWLRTVGSFGLIPLALTVLPFVRRRILTRYVMNVAHDPEIEEWLARYEIPSEEFTPSAIAKHLCEGRGLMVTGQSGIGKTSFLKFLTAAYAAAISDHKEVKADLIERYGALERFASTPGIPVFVRLLRYRGQKVEDMIGAQFASYGRLSDKQLISWYVDQGGFVFLFDGLNEVDEQTRNDVSRFVDQSRHRNCCCLSSQVVYPAFGWIAERRLAYLNPESVKRVLLYRLGEKRTEAMIRQFSHETFELYKVPQDAEFLVHMSEGEAEVSVPQSKAQLYDGVVATVFVNWCDDGRAEYRDILIRRAYEMVVAKDPVLNVGLTFAQEFINPLLDRKLVIQREANYYFQHNLIRDYLGSVWIRGRMKEVLSSATTVVDSNWFEMLRFALDSNGDAELCRVVIWSLLEKNRQLAGNLFSWLDTERPEMTQLWSAQFKIVFAESVLERG